MPTLSQTSAPVRISNTFFNVNNLPLDPYRGYTPITVPVMPTTFGGNPNLVPEQTESTTAGVVLEVPHRWLEGLSLSYDFYDLKYLNRISPSLAFADRLAIFPELFTRGPNLPGDQPGWPGPIISYDNRPVNISVNRISGWDAGLKYLRPTPWGELLLTGNVSRAYRNENRPRPGAPPAANAVPESLPLRTSGSLFWNRQGIETGALLSYRDKFKRSRTERFTPSAIRWDWRIGYDFSQSKWARPEASRWWQRAFAHSRLSLTIYNILADEPVRDEVFAAAWKAKQAGFGNPALQFVMTRPAFMRAPAAARRNPGRERPGSAGKYPGSGWCGLSSCCGAGNVRETHRNSNPKPPCPKRSPSTTSPSSSPRWARAGSTLWARQPRSSWRWWWRTSPCSRSSACAGSPGRDCHPLIDKPGTAGRGEHFA